MALGTGIENFIKTGSSNIKPKEYFLGFRPVGVTVQDILNDFNLDLPANELPILSIAMPDAVTGSFVVTKYNLNLPSGVNYSPLGDFATEKNLIQIDKIYPNEQTTEAALSAVNAVILPHFAIASLNILLSHLNNGGEMDVSDNSKIYYFKFSAAGYDYVYVLSDTAIRGVYGSGKLQFIQSDLIKFYTSAPGGITSQAILKEELTETIITSAVDVHDLNPGGKTSFSFTNAIAITGIDHSNLAEGTRILIRNNSEGLLFLNHLSIQSQAANRLYIVGEIDLSLRPDSYAELRVCKLRNRVELVNVYGTDYFPTMVNSGTVNRIMAFTPDGYATFEEVGEFLIVDDVTTADMNLATISTKYPIAEKFYKGLTVWQVNRIGGPAIYYKAGDGDLVWMKQVGGSLTIMT